MYVARPKIWVMLKPCGKLLRVHAYEKDFPHTTKKAHASTNPLIIPPPPLYRFPGQQERNTLGGMLRIRQERRGGDKREQGEENKKEERQGTKDNQVHQL